MTIKDLEAQVGLTRANIRFYEQEGLLSPARQSNGYRDYSREDAETLSKIKLFRQLQLDLDTIRALQAGTLSLTQALETQLAALEADQAALDRARQICRELQESGTSYAALDPGPWLAALERPPVPASPRYTLPKDRYVPPRSTRYPWRRFFARSLDLAICGLVWTAIYALGFHWNQPNGFWVNLLNTWVDWVLLLVLEPLSLHFWGTTPGKALFGISIRNIDGEKLSWNEALLRTWRVFAKGFGYGLPIYALWRQWKSYRACQDGERGPWEDTEDGWETYEIADDRTWRCWACAGAYALSIGLVVLILLQAMLPPNRGDLTAAEFYENYNFYIDYLGVNADRLDASGQKLVPADAGNVIVMELVSGPEYAVSVRLAEGVVTGVTVSCQAETEGFFWRDDTEAQLALLAFAGSLRELNCLNFRASAWAGAIEQQRNWNFDLTLRDLVRVTRSTELDGFEFEDSPVSVLAAREGQTATFHQEIYIRRAEPGGK